MKTTTIYETEKIVVKAVELKGELFYTTTYWLDDEGFAERQVTVYASGTVEEWTPAGTKVTKAG